MAEQGRGAKTYGILTASALHAPAAPADWIDLSLGRKEELSKLSHVDSSKSLTESSKVGKLGRVVRHGTHDPVRGSLPHGVKETTEDVKPDPGGISGAVDVEFARVGRDGSASVVPTKIRSRSSV